MDIFPVNSDVDIQIVADLAAEIWTQHFTPIIGAEQVRYMLNTVQSIDAITQAIRGEGYQYFIMSHEKEPFGYFAIALQDGDVFLSKLYIRQMFRGKGFAKEAMRFIESYAKENNARKIWLTVNKHNTDVINIYEKMGFCVEGPIVKDIGGGFIMDDFKMAKSI